MHQSVTFYLGFLWMVFAIACSIGGMLLVRRKLDISQLHVHHEVADPLLSVVGTLFSILLGFLVAANMERFGEARMNVQEEAAALGHVFRLAEGCDPNTRDELQKHCLYYVRYVLDEEWDLMEEKKSSENAQKQYTELWLTAAKWDTKTQGQAAVHEVMLDAMRQLGEFRAKRFAMMATELPAGMWVVVFVGAAATIMMTYFFEVKSVRIQVMLTGLVATVMSLDIFLLANYDYPFSGDVHVSTQAFEFQRDLFAQAIASRDERK